MTVKWINNLEGCIYLKNRLYFMICWYLELLQFTMHVQLQQQVALEIKLSNKTYGKSILIKKKNRRAGFM